MSQDIYNRLIIGGLFSSVGDIFFKQWSLSDNNNEYILGFLFYNIGIYFLVTTFKERNITMSVVIYILVNIISFALINSIYFNDHLSSTQIFGVILAVIAIIILEQ